MVVAHDGATTGVGMNSEVSKDTKKGEWLIYDDAAAGAPPPETVVEEEPWRVLIVDDDVDVHVVTRFSLRNVTYLGRKLKLFHAYTGKEAYVVLRDTPDIALVLLDVVMETADAGLRLATQIRGELNNHMVRVVLRTGHAGQALEQSVIVDYDINDYRTKTELTTQKLFTTVISSLRAYDSLMATERTQQALNDSLAKVKDLQLAMDQHSLVTITDQYGKIIHANEKFCEVSQYTIAELLGMDHRTINSNYHSKEFIENLWKTITQGRTWKGEFRNRAKDGSFYWVYATVAPSVDATGKPYQYVAIFTDISKRKEAEQRFKMSETRVRSLLEYSPIAVSIKRVSDNQRLFSNQSFVDMFHTTFILASSGADCAQFYQNIEDYHNIDRRVASGETIINQQLALQTLDQEKFWVIASFIPMEYESEPAVLSWFCDITKLKHA
jgi:PAS domain S-box-containing protein